MPRFAILEHDYPVPHWDLFLEAGDILRSWRLLAPLEPGLAVPAEPIGNHRLRYLDYEGPVSGNRGAVVGVDRGTFATEVDGPELVSIRIAGQRFVGRVTLQRMAEGWTCQFDPD
jgi:DNA polymerase Ligase (LigD)